MVQKPSGSHPVRHPPPLDLHNAAVRRMAGWRKMAEVPAFAKNLADVVEQFQCKTQKGPLFVLSEDNE